MGVNSLTKNQIEYQKLVETKRANQVNEAQTRWRDYHTNAVAVGGLNETIRHNYATEGLDRSKAVEAARHNAATEEIQLFVAQEGKRHNLEGERLQGEQITLGYSQLQESQRHNTAVESETYRHNLSVENETLRANQAREALNRYEAQELAKYHSQQIGLGYSQLSETTRSNQARESLNTMAFNWQVHKESSQLAETHRTNLANEQLIRERLYETQRSNLANEQLKGAQNVIRSTEAAETKRHNQAQEALKKKELNISLGKAVTGGVNDLASAGRNASQAALNALNTYDRAVKVIVQNATPNVPTRGVSFTSRGGGFGGGSFGGGASRGEVSQR